MRKMLIFVMLFTLSLTSCSKCTRDVKENNEENKVEVDTIVLVNPAYAIVWSFDSVFHDNTYDINMFDHDSSHIYSVSITAQSDTSLVGEYVVDTMKYNFVNLDTGSGTLVYSASGSYKIENTEDTTNKTVYHIYGSCALLDSTVVMFDFNVPVLSVVNYNSELTQLEQFNK